MRINNDLVSFRLPLHMKIRISDYYELNGIKLSFAMRFFCDEYFQSLQSERTQ